MSEDSAEPMRFDPHEMALRGRIGAHALHSKYDSREITAKARATFLERFEKEVDPDGILPEAERRRRAEHARKAYFAQLARKSAIARRVKGSVNTNGENDDLGVAA